MPTVETREEHSCFGGVMGYYRHASAVTGTPMNFAVYLPPQARRVPVPALYYLAGLTCDETTFMLKAGAQQFAARHGLALVACDTSPRGLNYPGEDASWDFGLGAAFYLDATQAPWSSGYRMGHYINTELPALIEAEFPVASDRRGIFGHSMGGHGALVTALRNPSRWQSVSAFAPVCHPAAAPWGRKAFGNFLGPDESSWAAWDASALVRQQPYPGELLVDQGEEDQFIERELMPDALTAAATASAQRLQLRRHKGYDHSYWFIQSFMADHLAHHADLLYP